MRQALALAALAAALLAGCLAGPATGDPHDGAPAGHELGLVATRTTGIVRGLVVDESLRPLDGVDIVVEGPRRAATGTDGQGAFGLDGLPPGLYFVHATKAGYTGAQGQADVQAGVSDPPALKMQLILDAGAQPYVTAQSVDGFIQCTSSALVLCGAANTVEQQFLCPGLGVCPGPLTNDRFTFTLYYPGRAALVQSELVWETTQPLSPELALELQALNSDAACPQVDPLAAETGALNATQGASPIAVRVHEADLARWEIGGPCGIFHSVFAGEASGLPIGVTLQQRFTLFSHSFHGYLPPADWTFANAGAPPQPP